MGEVGARFGVSTLPSKENTSSPFWLKPSFSENTMPQPGRELSSRLPVTVRAVGDGVARRHGLQPAQIGEAGRRARCGAGSLPSARIFASAA